MRLAPIGLTLGLVLMTVPLWLPRLQGEGRGPMVAAARPAPAPAQGAAVDKAFADVMAAQERAKGVVGAAPGLAVSGAGPADAAALIAEACGELARQGLMPEAECRAAAAAELAGQQVQPPAAGRLPQVAQPRRSQRPPDAKFVKVQP